MQGVNVVEKNENSCASVTWKRKLGNIRRNNIVESSGTVVYSFLFLHILHKVAYPQKEQYNGNV